MKASSYPKIHSVKALGNKSLLINFANGQEKVYDCRPLLQEEDFRLLEDEALFRGVKVDPGGWGISWNDEIDLSESELWLHGQKVEPGSASPL